MSHAERAGYLRAIAAKMQQRLAALGESQTHQMGVVASAAGGGAYMASMTYASFADMADTFPSLERHTNTMMGGIGLVAYEPVGVVAAIIPWNAPVMLAALKVAPALLAGCTVIVTIGFGGVKQSGIGREGGHNGLHAYLEPKTLLIDADVAWVNSLGCR